MLGCEGGTLSLALVVRVAPLKKVALGPGLRLSLGTDNAVAVWLFGRWPRKPNGTGAFGPIPSHPVLNVH